MINKSFVSLYFTPEKLQIVQLNGTKNNVVKIASVNLPKDLIVTTSSNNSQPYVVRNPAVLAKIIKSAWSKLHIKDKLVGIVIPEFATFTKLFMVPKISLAELDEAIKWQIQEYFPTNTENFIMDWRIAGKSDSNYQILAVLTQKEILRDYVKSCEEAGLLPLIVYIPSLALLSLTETATDDGKLIAYLGECESVLIAAEGEKVIATAILNSADEEEIVKTAKRILSHFKQLKIKTIYFGGKAFTPGLAEKVGNSLELSIQQVVPKISGLSAQGVQEYLIPIALQYRQTSEPSDPTTINLLPSYLVAKYQNSQSRLRAWSLILTLTLFIWFSFFSALGSYIFISQQIAVFTAKNQKMENLISYRKSLVEKIKEINVIAGKVTGIQALIHHPEEIFADLNNAKPEGITLESYKMDFDSGVMLVSGNAVDRQSLIQFKDNLENNSKVADVEIPISNLEVETNLTFKLTYNYAPISKNRTKSLNKDN